MGQSRVIPLNFLVLFFFLFFLIFMFPIERSLAFIRPATIDEALPHFDRLLQELNLKEDYSEKNAKDLLSHLQKFHHEVEIALTQEENSKGKRKWEHNKKDFLKYAILQLERGTRSLETKEKIDTFNTALNLLYMVLAEEKNSQKDPLGWRENTQKFYRFLIRLINKRKILHVKIPLYAQAPIGQNQALKESSNLMDPKQREKFIGPDQLSQMSPEKIGDLDIAENHPMWHNEQYRKQDNNPWEEQELWINKLMTQFLHKKYQIPGRFPNYTYDLKTAQKVLFFDDIKTSGTSPKIEAKDAFNGQWKIKWGAEIQPEVIANRLYLALGAKFVDPLYAIPLGLKGTVLILRPAAEDRGQKDPCHPVTVDDFVQCLKRSVYKFDLSSFIHTSGIITPDNIHEILKNLSPHALEKYRPQELMGRHYLTFKEASLEFSSREIMRKGGAISWKRFDNSQDRVKRGLLLFNSWINNIDPKEDNSKGYLLSRNYGDDPDYVQFIQAQHDMGNSLTGFTGPGNINELSVKEFILKGRYSLIFNYFLIYLPGAWKKTTYSDLLWMGKKISRLKRHDIESIVVHTHWPDFMQKAVVYKLLARRNRIAHLLNLTHLLDEPEISPPSMTVSLGTREERLKSSQIYEIPLDQLESALRPLDNNPIYNHLYNDQVLKNGRIKLCNASPLIRLLHQYRTPSGLDRRLINHSFLKIIPFLSKCGGLSRINVYPLFRKL